MPGIAKGPPILGAYLAEYIPAEEEPAGNQPAE